MKLSGLLAHPEQISANDNHGHHPAPRIWVILADQGRMRVYSRTNHEICHLGEGRPIAGEIFMRREAPLNRVFSSCSRFIRHTLAPRKDNRDKAKKKFARSITEWLSHAQQQDMFDKIILIAAPKFLGALRREIPQSLTPYIVAEIAKDLVNMPEQALHYELDAILWLRSSS